MTRGVISSALLEEVISKLDIVEVISEYLPLKKTGRNFKALCPFHQEKTPSFIVNREKQIFHCFGCGEGGNVIRFLMKIDNLSFLHAVEVAAKKAGIKIDVSMYKESGKSREIYKANEIAGKWYEKLLFSSQGVRAMDYLASRNISERDIMKFHLGFSPGIKDYLIKKINEEKLEKQPFIEAGLIDRETNTDIFRNRIIFPIFDVQGRIAGFGGRTIDEEHQPKYLNTSENEVFNKGTLLYGIYQARPHIKEKGFVFLVEGYFDVIKLHIHGIENAVAPMGTSLTEGQLRFLKRDTDKVLLAFDSDKPGINASLRNLENILKLGFEIKICTMPVNFDPDRFIDEYGIEAFKKVMEQSMDFLNFALIISSRKYDISTPKGKSSIAKEIVNLISLVPDEIEKFEYIKSLSHMLDLEEKILVGYLEKKGNDEMKLPLHTGKKESFYSSAEELLLEIVLSEDRYWREFLEWKGRLTKKLEVLANTSRELLSKSIEVTPANLISHLDETTGTWLSKILMKTTLIEKRQDREKTDQIFRDCLKKINKYCISMELEETKKKITEKKEMGIPYQMEMKTIQNLLFELKKE